ncbi:ATP-dependent DNA helicase [Liquorilactobacillus aquaticus DSM 21051]|uniref:ATP-dependent DNA helicase RecG n=1 Tax=Liquorilactobacillus aquaticus DSM 21051 TaxID=1423725 RepID=A0A0R2D3T2_9LACO|nr:ATP-dependent DNA helicase RecG [Liquorilactobacillus aquaticus]KRM96564.1 ATP-dependent DNA helicase [Liquorilactobacillus aquaticus DSM 21051]
MKSLADPVAALKGVGPKSAVALNKLGINTVGDLLLEYPFRYDDFAVRKLSEISDQEKVTLKGTVASEAVLTRFGRKKSRLNFRLLVDHDVIMVTFFNQPYLAQKVETGKEMAVYGKWDAKRQRLAGMKILFNEGANDLAGVYRSSKDIKQTTVKKLVKQAYDGYKDVLTDIIPEETRCKFRLLPRKVMIHDMHFPEDQRTANAARRSAIFDEFFCFQVKMQFVRKVKHKEQGIKIVYDNSQLKLFISSLPFELTDAQKKVVNEICSDMHRDIHMNRLLQGDVGSGKTVVAAIALYAAVTAGFQAALMAPTEILAQQHAEKLDHLFSKFNVNVALLTGSTASRTKTRRELLRHLNDGQIDIVVGTHALIQDDVAFKKLGLVITDEQHRFGVNQRQKFKDKGITPDVLAMTATPIPRTLAITLYGEMDVSTINELPKGRLPIETVWLREKQLNEAITFLKKQLSLGAQAYVISPLIEESEMMDLKNAEEIFAKLKKQLEPAYHVGLLHGRMKGSEKNEIMTDFKNKKFDILVSTTVIEVGVDVSNATMMLILDADRFGLAQLHQLRGRVGRGKKQSYCFLIADPKNEYGVARMKVMAETNDGFVIAQKDLELRGQGDILGNKQSGVPDFRVGDPVTDLRILQAAQQEASEIINDSEFTRKSSNKGLINYLRYELDKGISFD